VDFTITGIVITLITSAIAFVYLSYGRKMAEMRFIVCGALLMVYPYFTDSTAAQVIVGVVLAAVPFTVWR